MNFKLFFIDQINFRFDDGFSILENIFQRIWFNLKRDIYDLINFLNFVIKFRYFLGKNRNICFRFWLNLRYFLICFLSYFLNLLIFIQIDLRNLLLVRLFYQIKRCDSKWTIWIYILRTKIILLFKVSIMISKASRTI